MLVHNIIIYNIYIYFDLKTKCVFEQTNSHTCNLTNIGLIDCFKHEQRITNEILCQKKYRNLKKIEAYSNIADVGISKMQLHTLYAWNDSKITDAGISKMQLHTLDASDNSNITDVGISNMRLHTLNADGDSKITDVGISNMRLHTLHARDNFKITYVGISKMRLHTLNHRLFKKKDA